ncbi:MAG: hypothetical protein A2W80_18235 [Candidatus Riflebacteria bacterium GWC2_50_8]|nr:MAG: hypothetical protein A2W80_18235 [Candidatus Riflebacteria bacterium GWC2_50_8]
MKQNKIRLAAGNLTLRIVCLTFLCLVIMLPAWAQAPGQAGGQTSGSVQGRGQQKGSSAAPEITLVIRETPENLERIEQLIKTLDIAPRQVFIEAHIFDISLDNNNSTGVDWSALMTQIGRDTPLWQYDHTVLGESAGNGTFRLGNLNSDHFSMLLRSLKTNNKARSLSNPRITALNGQVANIMISQKVPYITTNTIDTTGGQQRTERIVNFEEIPISLDVTPMIYDNQTIRMSVTPNITSLRSFVEGVPWTEGRTATTELYVKDGETIILGGLITENQLEERNNTPLLDKIPLARKLFSRREKSAKRSELVVFITPHIITSSRTPPSMKPKIAGGAM